MKSQGNHLSTRYGFCLLITMVMLFSIRFEAFAGLKLTSMVGSGMVLQRNSEVKIWGWGDPGEKVTVMVDWMNNISSANVDQNGKWQAKILTGKEGGPYNMKITSKTEEIVLENIMLGEVWVCSGQSNMDFTINMFGGWNKTFPEERDEFLREKYESIRLFSVEKDTSNVPNDECKGQWKLADTASVAEFSATAWFFAVELYKKLKIPVGLVVSAWGGTPAEAWTPLPVVESNPELQFYRSDPNKNDWFPTAPAVLYNAMINPLTKMKIRGAIWYQGESNVTDADTYPGLFSAMIDGWRQAWGNGNFPFYYVQIAPFTYERAVVGAQLREAQFKCMSTPNTGMVVTMDIAGDVTDIHPRNKQDVGKRLASWALSGTYDIEGIPFSGPLFSGFEKRGKEMLLKFDQADHGLVMKNRSKDPTGFMISGEDRHFVPAKVSVQGDILVVKSERVPDPVAVRYAYTNTSTATLFNGKGLPASSFRTDNWPLVTDLVFMKPAYDEKSGDISYELSSTNSLASIYYTLDGSEPDTKSILYSKGKIILAHPATILARACINGILSESIGSWEIRQHKGMASHVDYLNEFSARYSAGGKFGLVDGVSGSLAFNDGAWQGFEGDDLDITIDLGQMSMIRKATVHFLSDTNSWIFLPKYVEVKVSKNGTNYENVARYDNLATIMKSRESMGKQVVSINATLMRSVRYIRIKADNIGVCPPGHPGAGEKAWLFVDEVELE
jgi:sialate O-acetylesterase